MNSENQRNERAEQIEINTDRTTGASEIINRASHHIRLSIRETIPQQHRTRFSALMRYIGITLALVAMAIAAYALVEILFMIISPLLGISTLGYKYTYAIRILGFIVLALMWDLVGGQMGYASFGNIAFFGIGVYTVVMLLKGSIGWIGAHSFTVALLAAGVVSLLYAILLGIPLLRLRGHYFAVATLGVLVATQQLVANMKQAGLGSGLVVPQTGFGDVNRTFFLLFSALAIASSFTYLYLTRARFGLGLNTIRDDEGKANSMGIHATKYKILAWSISALFTGIAGGLFAVHNAYVNPVVAFNVDWTVLMILMVLVGGVGRFWGPVIGAAFLWTIRTTLWNNPPYVQWMSDLIGFPLGEAYIIVFGIILIIIVVVAPSGILGYLESEGVFEYATQKIARTPLGHFIKTPNEVDSQ